MRLVLFLLLISIFQTIASAGYSQSTKITLKSEDLSLVDVLSRIEDQSEYRFIYDKSQIDLDKKVKINFDDASLKVVLDDLFLKNGINYQVIDNQVILNRSASVAMQQSQNVSGKVTDSSGLALPGVTVVVKGTTQGTITSNEGNYTLMNVPGNATLVFSFVGMKTQEVAVAGKSNISVTLIEESIGIEEVVAIGYGTMKKSDLTGAIAQIDPTKMEERLTSNVTDLLRNNMAGLYIPFSVDAKGSVDMDDVLIRGTNSLKASNTPLIILDGMIYDGDLANISSADIQSIDVMKDASSAAIYGSRAANGVIIINTKQGKSGAPKINLTVNTGLATTSFLRPVYNPVEYLEMHSVYSSTTLPRQEVGFYSNPNNLPAGVSLSQWLAYNNASGDPTNVWLSRIGLYQTEIDNYNAGKTIDWGNQVFQLGLRQDYLMSITGGTDRIKYYWSANYTDNEGYVKGQEYSSIRSRLNLESKISSFLTIGLNAQLASRDESSVSADGSAYIWESPYASKYEEDGETLKYLTYDYLLSRNPFYEMAYTDRYQKSMDLNSKIYAIIELPFGISYQVNAINNFSGYRSYQHVSSESEANSNGGEASRQNRTYYTWTIDNIIKWNKTFGSHDFDLTLLANAEKQQSWRDDMVNSKFFPSDILGYHGMGIGQDPRISSDDQTYSRDALLARLNYSFSSKYLLTLAMRRDGYSAFGQSNPHAYFPTAAVAWKISEESFFNVEPIDFLKLRLSWGANGNSAIGTYSALATMESRKFLYSVDGIATPTSELRLARMANASLQWEKTTALNGGLDFGLFNNKLSGSIEAYLSETTGLLVDRKLPSVTGYGSVAANLGQINNKGVEIMLNSINVDIKEKLLWRTSFNASLNKNEIVSLYGDMIDVYDDEGNVTGQEEASDYTNGWFIGESIDVIWDYDSDGIWQEEDKDKAYSFGGYYPGQFRNVDVNEDGKYDSKDKQFLGHRNPQFRWNLTNDLTILNNISLSFSLVGQHGHIQNYTDAAGPDLYETGNGLNLPYWTPENRSNKYPSMRGNGGTNYLSKAFVRLSNITLGYDFPSRITQFLKINSLKVYGSVDNVHVWTKWPGWDPENTGGPSPRYFNLGVNVSL